MVLLFSWGIDRRGPLFCWYQVQQEDAYQLRLIRSNGNYRGCERGLNTTPMPMEITTMKGAYLTSHSKERAWICTLDFKPRLGYKNFFSPPPFFLLLLPLVITFFLHFVILFIPRRQMNEQTSERTVTLLFSCHAHLLLTITNFLHFASFLLLLTLDQLRR
jgi:hypothetical protein